MNSDLISREALKKALKSNCDLCHDKNTNWCEHCCPLNDFEDLIDNAPTVKTYCYFCGQTEHGQVVPDTLQGWKYEERPQGEWVKIGDIGLAYTCNKCGEVNVIPTNFCPNCGANMMKGGAE